MGKGVGSFLRWVTQIKPNSILLQTHNVNYLRIIKIKNSLSSLVGVPTSVKFSNFFR